jgi:hypothetical protein
MSKSVIPAHIHHKKEEDKEQEAALIATSVLAAVFGIGFFTLLGIMVHSMRTKRSGSTSSAMGGALRNASSKSGAGALAPPAFGGVLKSMGIERRRIPGTNQFTWTASRR